MSSKGKHYSGTKRTIENSENQKSKNKSIKFLLLLFGILIVVIIVILLAWYFGNKILNHFSSEPDIIEAEIVYVYSEKVETSKPASVEGAEYLEITGLYINSDDPELSTVSARLKNTSDTTYENVKLRITLYDENDNEITFLDYKIEEVEANGEAITYAALKQDLSNCQNYTIALQESQIN